VAFTPKPRVVKLQLLPLAKDSSPMGEVIRYHIRSKLGLIASLLVADIPDTQRLDPPGRSSQAAVLHGTAWRVEPH
jgi:hypothetical protein